MLRIAGVWFIGTLSLVACFVPANAQQKKDEKKKAEPRVLVALPLGAAPGHATKITLRGIKLDNAKDVQVEGGKGSAKIVGKGKANIPDGVPDKNPEKVGDTQVEVLLTLNPNLPGEPVQVVVVTPEGDTKPHPILVEPTLRVVKEKEPNDGFRQAQELKLPAVVEGSVDRQRDVDVYRIDGKKGQKVVAEVLANRHGSLLDAMLTVYDAAGQEVASHDDVADSRDARLELTLPADGVYYLSLIDAHDLGSPLHPYRLSVR